MANPEETDWLPVIGRSLAFLCLHYGDMGGKDLAERGHFLEQLGLPRKDSAALLDTTVDSLRVTLSTAKKKAPAKKPAKKTASVKKKAPAKKRSAQARKGRPGVKRRR